MTLLIGERCVPCRADSPPVTESEIRELSPHIPEWEFVEEEGIPRLVWTFRFPDFKQAPGFTGEVGEMADAEAHHPRITAAWGRVRVTWWTHNIKNIHRNDLIMAAKTDRLCLS